MANIIKAYGAEIKLSFIYGDNEENVFDIDPNYISYMIIMSNYENQVIPIIMMSINVKDELYELLLKYKNLSKFYLSINKSNILSNSPLAHHSFTDYFSFIMSDNSPNTHKKINSDESYRVLNIGLISYKMINNNRKTFNGIYKNIDTNTLINIALEGIDCIYEGIYYNKKFDTIIIPPITTRYKFLSFIQDLDPFYDTQFKYFMDFDSAYLMSDDYLRNTDKEVTINIRDIETFDFTDEGMTGMNDSYNIDVPQTQYKVQIDQYKEKILDKIIGVEYDFNIYDEYDFDKDDVDRYSINKDIFIRTDMGNIIKNKIESEKIIVQLYKNNIDGSIFTPDRKIIIHHFDDKYSKYDGEYKLVDKKEIYSANNGKFNLGVSLTLKFIGNVSKYDPTEYRSSKTYTSNTSINKNINVS